MTRPERQVQIGRRGLHRTLPHGSFWTVTLGHGSVLWTAIKCLDRIGPRRIVGLTRREDRCGWSEEKGWCRRRDLNPHGLRHTPLKRACLPFHHFGYRQELEKLPQLRSRIAHPLNVLNSTPRAFARCGLVAGLFEAPASRSRNRPSLGFRICVGRFTNDGQRLEGGAL
ncbi:MAG: hypothetical protein RL768_556 [Nitrospirota bacterium]